MRARASTLNSIQSRETTLEEEQIHYTHIAAQTQRELEDKSRQLDRVLAEKRWIEADQQSLADQLSAMKSRVEEQQKQVSRAALNARCLPGFDGSICCRSSALSSPVVLS